MIERTYPRFGATALLVVTCLVVGLGVSGSASASGNLSTTAGADKVANKAARANCLRRTVCHPFCPRRTVCLYPDSNFRGKQRRYYCRGFRPGTPRTAQLSESGFPACGNTAACRRSRTTGCRG